MIQKDIDALEREKSNSIKKNNILKTLENIDAIFTGTYLHYRELPKKNNIWKKYCRGCKIKKTKIGYN